MRVALLIGNSHFPKAPELGDLEGPPNDVFELRRVLQDAALGGFQVRYLTNNDTHSIIDGIEGALTLTGLEGACLLYYSGRAIVDHSGRLFLAATDTETSSLATTAVSVPFLKYLIERASCSRVLVFLDCCYEGTASGQNLEMRVSDQLCLLRDGTGPRTQIISSSSSIEIPDDREDSEGIRVMGTLTRCFVEGVETGAADLDADGRISLGDLQGYLGARLPEKGPEWFGILDGDNLVLAESREPIPGLRERTLTAVEKRAVRGRRNWLAWLGLALGASVAVVALLWSTMLPSLPARVRELRPEDATSYEMHGPALVRDLQSLRFLAASARWIEHRIDQRVPLASFRSAFFTAPIQHEAGGGDILRLARSSQMTIRTVDDVFAFGLRCTRELNQATVTVRLRDGSEFSFDVETYFQQKDFYGFVTPEPIEEIRIETEVGTLSLQEFYFYANRVHERVPEA